jgi:ubiquinone/menaquinone biosynthesis C-methylase UbiE
MKHEKYIVEIGSEGSEGLELLDSTFNKSTQEFLINAGLMPGMKVLDIGCGSGVMTSWIAQQVGLHGCVVGIENNENQLNAAKKRIDKLSIENCKFKLCSAYDLESLNEKFDFVYCRFVLHHLNDPDVVISKIFQVLNSNGIYASEEGIGSATFSYPFSKAWGDHRLGLPHPWIDVDSDNRDINIGVKMFTKMHAAGFKIIFKKIVQPLLTTREEKKLLLVGRDELKSNYLSEGHSEEEWTNLGKELEKLIDNDAQIVGFYGSCQVAGKKY